MGEGGGVGESPGPPNIFGCLAISAMRCAPCIHFSRFEHTVGGRSPASPSIQLGSSAV